jgi:hypothetical protein
MSQRVMHQQGTRYLINSLTHYFIGCNTSQVSAYLLVEAPGIPWRDIHGRYRRRVNE